MLKRRVRFTWNESPTLAPDECVAEIVDAPIGRDVDHRVPRLGKILR